MFKRFILASLCCLSLVLPALFWLNRMAVRPEPDPVATLTQYLKHLYARDFRQAYRFLSSEDRRLKSSNQYVRERGEFTGFALVAARKLAGQIDIRLLSSQLKSTRRHLTVAMKLPDAAGIADLLLDWDEEKLNTLSVTERKHLLTAIDRLIGAGKLPMIEGEEKFILVQEGPEWKVYVDWAAGAQVQFAAALPAGAGIAAEPLTRQTMARSGDVFTVGFKVRNPTNREIVTRIVHRVVPKELAPYLELVECALLLPVRLRPGEAQTYRSTYLVRGDLPDGSRTVNVTYEFAVENR
jgi:hypothetical protein